MFTEACNLPNCIFYVCKFVLLVWIYTSDGIYVSVTKYVIILYLDMWNDIRKQEDIILKLKS